MVVARSINTGLRWITHQAKVLAGFALACLCTMLLAPAAAHAQAVTQYTVTDAGGTNDITGATTCAAPLVQNFTVGTSFIVSDVDLGFFASHTWRGDIRLTLQSPLGTRVQLIDGDSANFVGQNLNVRLSDGSTPIVNGAGHTTNDNLTPVPTPYQNTLGPNSALSAFNGENSFGTWRLEICDIFPSADDGNFQRTDLWLTAAPPYADLSLTKTVSNATPANGTAISYTLTVANAGSPSLAATGIIVRDLLPGGVTFVSSSDPANYDAGTGNWTVGTLAPGASQSLTINATVSATSGATVINTAEVIASSLVDIDSTVNNGVTSEDDFASRSFTVTGTRVAGTPPSLTLACSVANRTLFDWNGKSWTVGDLTNNFTIPNIGNVTFEITTDTAFVAGSPAINSTNTSTLATSEQSLFQNMNNALNSDTSVTVIKLPTAVPGLQFTIFDIDFGNNSFSDKITVTGEFNGATVIPTLTNGIANYVAGNTAIGDAGSGSTSADGDVVVTFLTPVDEITITYGNHTTAPANPGNQFASIHDFNFCNPVASVTVAKSSWVVEDFFNPDAEAKAIPGATLRYCLTLTNGGSGTATNVIAFDSIPSTVSYIPGTIRSGSSTCLDAATAEDDNNTGANETDPVGASVSGTSFTGSIPSLGPSSTVIFTFDTSIQ